MCVKIKKKKKKKKKTKKKKKKKNEKKKQSNRSKGNRLCDYLLIAAGKKIIFYLYLYSYN